MDNFKQKILEEISRTEKLINNYRETTKPIPPDEAIGRITRMDAIVNKGVAEASLRQAQTRLTQLRMVLSNIDSDDFGVCQNCGEPIAPARILAIPETSYCVHCAE
jgi:DnaK suppressor protein